MKVLISYSTADIDIVRKIDGQISTIAQVFYWDKDKEPGKDAWNTIFKWVDSADIAVSLITDKTLKRAMSVGLEIGHAK